MKRPALQNKQAGVLRMAFRARKAFGTFEKRAPGEQNWARLAFTLNRYLKLLNVIKMILRTGM